VLRRVHDQLSGLGFVAAVGQQSGVIAAGSDRFALPRFPLVDAVEFGVVDDGIDRRRTGWQLRSDGQLNDSRDDHEFVGRLCTPELQLVAFAG